MSDGEDERSRQNKILLLRTRDVEAWSADRLIELSRDEEADVRDWATFALAARDDDGVEVRQALLERAGDADFDTRSEALWGLARRRDERALPLLVEALRGDQVGELFIEAAGFFARPELVGALEELKQWWRGEAELLAEAMARCRGDHGMTRRMWDIVPANDQPD